MWIFFLQRFKFDAGHNRIHKETSRITHHPGIRQFLLTDGDNHPAHGLQCHRRILLQFPADSTVIQRIIFLLT